MNGKDLLIYRNGSAIAAAKSCDIKTSCKTEELSNYGISGTANQWKRVIAGERSWSVSVSTLVTSALTAKAELLNVGMSYTLTMRTSLNTSTIVMAGDAILTTFHVTAKVGNLIKGSFTFTGTGPLS